MYTKKESIVMCRSLKKQTKKNKKKKTEKSSDIWSGSRAQRIILDAEDPWERLKTVKWEIQTHVTKFIYALLLKFLC